ncbi:hypothetical protein BD779DRAFT_1674407 [Infundibulicybe gibba]|nr:hypothetical protein BD779DRAFT_1674407 [Infundibulicybe gibba]
MPAQTIKENWALVLPSTAEKSHKILQSILMLRERDQHLEYLSACHRYACSPDEGAGLVPLFGSLYRSLAVVLRLGCFSLTFTGIWVIGHECGHEAFSDHKWVNNIFGFITHPFLWTPGLSWKISHHRQHSNHEPMKWDEVYVPKIGSDLGILAHHDGLDHEKILSDTPIYMLIWQQVLAFPAYLLSNVSGQKIYPK